MSRGKYVAWNFSGTSARSRPAQQPIRFYESLYWRYFSNRLTKYWRIFGNVCHRIDKVLTVWSIPCYVRWPYSFWSVEKAPWKRTEPLSGIAEELPPWMAWSRSQFRSAVWTGNVGTNKGLGLAGTVSKESGGDISTWIALNEWRMQLGAASSAQSMFFQGGIR